MESIVAIITITIIVTATATATCSIKEIKIVRGGGIATNEALTRSLLELKNTCLSRWYETLSVGYL